MKAAYKTTNRFSDPRAQRVIGFLAAKKLLITDQFKLWPNIKIPLEDAIWVGRHVEPRVLEVLPAALIHFPGTFFAQRQMPNALKMVIEAIRRNNPEHPDFEGVSYQDMKRWVDRALPDKRTKPLKEQKRNKTFRLKPSVVNALKHLAKQQKLSETAILERLILNHK